MKSERTQELYRSAFDLFSQRTDKEWSLTDCISFVVMQQRGLTEALTSDGHFEQAGFKALLRAIRAALSIQQKYTVAELKKPFIVPALVPHLDTSDPMVKELVTRKALGMELYPNARAPHAGENPRPVEPEETRCAMRPVTRRSPSDRSRPRDGS